MNALDSIKMRAGQKAVGSMLYYLKSGELGSRIDNLITVARLITRRKCDREFLEMLKVNLAKENSPQKKLLESVLSKNPEWIQKSLLNFFVNSLVVGRKKTIELEEKFKMPLPFFLLIDPTERCNYRCEGCWAANFNGQDMPYELFDRMLTEAKEMGIYFVTVSGGEPTLYPRLFDIMKKHSDISFHFYTNGSMLAIPEFAKEFCECGNGFACFSLEGFEERTDKRRGAGAWKRVMKAMDNLNRHGVGFGLSCTATKESHEEITSNEFIDFMVDKGALLLWYFMYIPIGRDPNFDMVLTPEMRRHMWKRSNEIRHDKPIVVADFWNDGPITDGCLAAGRRYVHITSNGDVEPCAFVHFHSEGDNIGSKSLMEVLRTSKLFETMRKYQEPAYEGNPMRPCWIVDRPWQLRKAVSEAGATVSEDGSLPLLNPTIYEKIDRAARDWEPVANAIWESIQEYNKRYDDIVKMVGEQKDIHD
ncbi:MAG TPA: radical SAM protein [Caldisericia bacterium]|nr:radical SAM protein [Caldisericia bacterium]HPF48966.1 radical SAM protein [Caldisericia bacterium]HPI83170.1 radical SAM protein [Caldisericia bacterium]HPQ92397.1 radical SAM protein [Caldisericia bacterium]HRV74505.1 radical SAM protein [Caldisericia bacterium]